MSTRIKVFNYVMTAPIAEARKTLDEARALLGSRTKAIGAVPVAAGNKPKAKAKPKVVAKPVVTAAPTADTL